MVFYRHSDHFLNTQHFSHLNVKSIKFILPKVVLSMSKAKPFSVPEKYKQKIKLF